MDKPDFVVGIDPGTHTGYAVWDVKQKKFIQITSDKIHNLIIGLEGQKCFMHDHNNDDNNILIRVEDARKRKWYGKSTKGKDQGVGSIKRDCTIWEDFLKDEGFRYEMVDPKTQKTKMTAEHFRKLTGWEGSTNEHSRDAAMLVFGH